MKILLVLLLLAAPASAAEYTFETIEYPDADETIAQGINDIGQVTGYHSRTIPCPPSEPRPCSIHIPEQGFVWLNGKFAPVEFPTASQTVPTGINNSGDIVGTADLSVRLASFLYEKKPHAKPKKAAINELALPISTFGFLIGLNDANQYVGQFQLPTENRQVGLLLDDGQLTAIDPEITECQASSSARGVNTGLVIVGFTFCDNPFGWLGFVSYDGGDNFVLFDVPGAFRATVANSVNEHNEIAGNYQDSSGTHGFVFSNGRFISIDVPGAQWTIVSGINNRGEVTGFFVDQSGMTKSFVATPERGWRR